MPLEQLMKYNTTNDFTAIEQLRRGMLSKMRCNFCGRNLTNMRKNMKMIVKD